MEVKSEFMASIPIGCITKNVNNASFISDKNKTVVNDKKAFNFMVDERDDAYDSSDFGNSICAEGSFTEYSPLENTIHKKNSIHSNAKLLPRSSMKHSNTILEGMYVYAGELKVQPQRHDANLQQKPLPMLQLQAAVAAHSRFPVLSDYGTLCLNEFEYMNVDAVACTTDPLICPPTWSGKQRFSSKASLRLQPHFHSNQPNKSFEGNNANSTDLYPNIEYNTLENTTINPHNTCGHGDLLEDASQLTYYATTVQNRCYTEMSSFDYTKFNDYDGTSNNDYINNYSNLSSCCDVPGYTTTTAHKQYLQQQRKYAIMMAMTTASVIASGEIRVPVQRFTEGSKLTTYDRPNEHRDFVAGKQLYETDNYDCMNIDLVIRDLQDGVNLESKLVDETTKHHTTDPLVTVSNISFTASLSSSKAIIAANELKRKFFKSAPSSLITTTKKLPKRLPTLQYNENNNTSHRTVKANGKKLPELPIEKNQADNSKGQICLTQIDKKMPKEICADTKFSGTNISSKIPSTSQLNVGNNIPLSLDTITSLRVSPSSKKLTQTSITAYSPLYQESFLTHSTDRRKLSETGTDNKFKEDTYFASIKPYAPILTEEMTLSTTMATGDTTATSLSTSTKIKSVSYGYRNNALTSNTRNATIAPTTNTASGGAFADSKHGTSKLNCSSNNLKWDHLLESKANNNFNDSWIGTSTISSSYLTSSTGSELLFYLTQDGTTSLNNNINSNNVDRSCSSFLHKANLSSLSTPLYTYIALPTTSIVETMTTTSVTPATTPKSTFSHSDTSLPTIATDFTSSTRQFINSSNQIRYGNNHIRRENNISDYTSISSNVCEIVSNSYTSSEEIDTIIFDAYYKRDISSYFVPSTTAAIVVSDILTTIALVTATVAADSTAMTAGYKSSTIPILPLKTLLPTHSVLNLLSNNKFSNPVIPATPKSMLVEEKKSFSDHMMTTKFDLPNSGSAILPNSANTIADTTTTSYMDYLTRYQMPVKQILDTSNIEKQSKCIRSEIRSNLTNFMACDKTTQETNCKLSSALHHQNYLATNSKCMTAISNTSMPNETSIENYTANIDETENIFTVDDIYPPTDITLENHSEAQVLPVATESTTMAEYPKYDSVVDTVPDNRLQNDAQKTLLRDLLSEYTKNSTGVKTDTNNPLYSSPCRSDNNQVVGDDDETKYTSEERTGLPIRSLIRSSAFNGKFTDSNNTYVETVELLSPTLPLDKVVSKTSTESITQIGRCSPSLEGPLPLEEEYKTVTSTTQVTRNISTEVNVSQGVHGKAASMFDGISRGIKTGLDGVLGGVNNAVATTDIRVKEQQKKKGFGFSIASKFVPNVGGLIAGATAAVQQTSMIKSDQRSYAVNTIKETNNTIADVLVTKIATTATASENVSTSSSVMENGNWSNNSYDQFYFITNFSSHINQFSEPKYTHSGNLVSKQHSDNTVYMHQRLCKSKDVACPIVEYDSGSYNFASVPNENVHLDGELDNIEYNAYSPEIKILANDFANHNVIYTDEICVANRNVMISTTSIENDNLMTTTYYHPQEGMEVSNPTLVPKNNGSLLSTQLTSFGINVSGDCVNDVLKLPLTSAATGFNKAVSNSGSDTTNGSMIESLLGKAAAAVQSATQAVNQVTSAVQENTSLSTSTEAAAVSTAEISNNLITDISSDTNGYALNENNDCKVYHLQDEQQICVSQRSSWPSQHTGSTSVPADCENRILFNYDNSEITTANVTLTGNVDTTALPPNTTYYLSDNQSQRQPQRQQSGKILPTVPLSGSIGKKLPTINTNKVSYLIMRHPKEICDDKLSASDVTDTNEFQLMGVENGNEFFCADEDMNDLNDHEPCDIDCGKLNHFIGEDSIHNSHNCKPQELNPNCDTASDKANYYTGSQLKITPSDLQQNIVPQYQEQTTDAKSYYENFDGDYNYEEDYFNEEDEYKYLAKEQELLFKQQQQVDAVKQKQPQDLSCQQDVEGELYLEADYQSEFNDNYMEEDSRYSTVGLVANNNKKIRNQLKVGEQGEPFMEGEGVVDFMPMSAISEITLASSRDNRKTEGAPHPVTNSQQQIKKQGSIIIEEDGNDNIFFNEAGAMINNAFNEPPSRNRKSGHEATYENAKENRIAEQPLLTIVAKKKVLKRGETEEVVGGHMHVLRKQEITAKQRWHWAYNKIIIQLNMCKNELDLVLSASARAIHITGCIKGALSD